MKSGKAKNEAQRDVNLPLILPTPEQDVEQTPEFAVVAERFARKLRPTAFIPNGFDSPRDLAAEQEAIQAAANLLVLARELRFTGYTVTQDGAESRFGEEPLLPAPVCEPLEGDVIVLYDPKEEA